MAFVLKKGDTSPVLEATFKDYDGTAVSIISATVKILVKTLDGVSVVNSAMTITDGINGVAEYGWQSGDTDTAGTYKVEFEVTFDNGSVETFPNTGYEMLVIKEDLG